MCECFDGYSFNDRFKACLNHNECLEPGTCPTNSVCIDTDGSYMCVCSDGFQEHLGLKGTICIDIDECDQNPCPINTQCRNFHGSYTCTCPKGYSLDAAFLAQASQSNQLQQTLHAQHQQCTDIDECSPNRAMSKQISANGQFTVLYQGSSCPANSNCYNTPGSYKCLCKTGYRDEGTICGDIDECSSRVNDCSKHATCENLNGDYLCKCRNGWQAPKNSQGRGSYGCVDIDECLNDLHDCPNTMVCANTAGSFKCTCPTGYSFEYGRCVNRRI